MYKRDMAICDVVGTIEAGRFLESADVPNDGGLAQ